MKTLALTLALLATPAIAQTTPGQVGIVTDMWAGTDAKAGQDLEIFDNIDPENPLRIIPMGGRGAIQNLRDILYLRGVDVGFVPSDAVLYARENHLIPNTDLKRIQYVAKLYDEEVHVLAGSDITLLTDLNGKKINVDVLGSGSAMTADVLFRALGIHADVRHERQAEGLMSLRRGEIDAIVQVGGAPVPLLAALPPGLHFVPVPIAGDLVKTYLPTEITHDQYPALVDAPVKTLAIGDVLAVFGWDRGTERYRNVARFVDALYSRIAELQKPPRHPKWRDVNLAASVPGWTLFPEAEAKRRDKFMFDMQDQMALQGGVKVMSPELRMALFRDFEKWRDRGKR